MILQMPLPGQHLVGTTSLSIGSLQSSGGTFPAILLMATKMKSSSLLAGEVFLVQEFAPRRSFLGSVLR
jgi:hypothetical protein